MAANSRKALEKLDGFPFLLAHLADLSLPGAP
jgi:hypothetical protein